MRAFPRRFLNMFMKITELGEEQKMQGRIRMINGGSHREAGEKLGSRAQVEVVDLNRPSH